MRVDGSTNTGLDYSGMANSTTVNNTAVNNTQQIGEYTIQATEISTKSSQNNLGIQEPVSAETLVNQLTKTEKNALPVSDKFLLDVVEKANKAIANTGRSFEYAVHEKTKQVMIKVVNKENNEVIREIPSEKMLDMFAAMLERAGLLVDEKR